MKKTYGKKDLVKAFSLYIRLRDADEYGFTKCFTCLRYMWWKDFDCGHGHGRQHAGTMFNEKNNHAQCGPCNMDGGRQDIYKTEVDKLYGPGTWDLLEMQARKPTKNYSAFEYEHLTKHFLAEFEKLKKIKIWQR